MRSRTISCACKEVDARWLGVSLFTLFFGDNFRRSFYVVCSTGISLGLSGRVSRCALFLMLYRLSKNELSFHICTQLLSINKRHSVSNKRYPKPKSGKLRGNRPREKPSATSRLTPSFLNIGITALNSRLKPRS